MKILYIIIIINILSFFISAQELLVEVKDASNKEPIAGAIVFLQNRYYYTSTQGTISISGLKQDEYKIKIYNIGYTTYSGVVRLEAKGARLAVELVPSPVRFEDIIVSSRRRESIVSESPYSEAAVGREHLSERQFLSVPDAIAPLPGVNIVREGAWGNEINIRGLSRQNVVTLIDGVRLETATDISARLSLVDLNDLERVEIIKGAASSLYGTGATGGIVNIVTRRGDFTDKLRLRGSFSGGYNSVNNMPSTGASVYLSSSNWVIQTSGSYRKAENIQTPLGELKNSMFEDYNLSSVVKVMPAEGHLAEVNFQRFKATNVGIPGGLGVFPVNAEVRYPFELREMISAGYRVNDISDAVRNISLKYSYQNIVREVENIPNQVRNIPATGTAPASRVTVLKITPGANHYFNGINLNSQIILGEHLLNTGVDYWSRRYSGERERFRRIEILDTAGNVVNVNNQMIMEKPLPDSKYESIGYYLQDDFYLSSRLLITAGGRFDRINISGEETLNPLYEINNGVLNPAPAGQRIIWRENKTHNISFSGNGGALYSVTKNLDLRFTAGYAFRSPSLEERFQYIDQGGLLRLGNPELKPEIGKTFDGGVRYNSASLSANGTLFFNYFNDLVVDKPTMYEGSAATVKENVGEARLYGFEIQIYYNLRDILISGSGAYVKGEDITGGNPLPQIPPLNGLIEVTSTLGDYLKGRIGVNYFLDQRNTSPGEMETAGYILLNLTLQSGVFSTGMISASISAGVENLLNKEHRNHLSTARGNQTIEPGRNIFVRLNLNW
jgi:hemoglobin/transferrin/lactoferrin receptor protein